jgi:hypothetical protein
MNTKYGGPGMRVKGSLLIIAAALFLCLGGSVALAAQADQDKKDQPAAQSEESTKAKGADQEKNPAG